jgi:hypothetical protein
MSYPPEWLPDAIEICIRLVLGALLLGVIVLILTGGADDVAIEALRIAVRFVKGIVAEVVTFVENA